MRLLVCGGTVVTPEGSFAASVACEDGRIAGIHAPDEGVPADEALDATGLLVFPGFIDPHVHCRDPGLTHKEDLAHATRAAAAGGVTTIFDMPNAVPPVSDAALFRERTAHHEASACVDFGLWAISLGAENLAEVPDLLAAGAIGIKLFWGYALHRGTKQLVYNLADEPPENLILPPGNGDVLDLFRTVAGAGGLLAAHCEDRGVIEAAERARGREPADYEEFLVGRPDTAEAAAVALGAELARATGCRFHVLHTASARGVELVRRARREGVSITAETCPQYLTLTAESYASVGPSMKAYPPIRRAADREALWEGVLDGAISSIGSDHAPHTAEEKGRSLAAQPAGVLGVETMVPVLLNEVARGRLAPERLALVLSEGTARLFGVHPQKGAIRPGSDADLTLVDPHARWTIRNERLHSKLKLSAWHGVEVTGAPRLALVRGQVVMRDGEPVGEPIGRLVAPARTG